MPNAEACAFVERACVDQVLGDRQAHLQDALALEQPLQGGQQQTLAENPPPNLVPDTERVDIPFTTLVDDGIDIAQHVLTRAAGEHLAVVIVQHLEDSLFGVVSVRKEGVVKRPETNALLRLQTATGFSKSERLLKDAEPLWT